MLRITSYLICMTLLLFVFSCSDISLGNNADGDLESGEDTIIADCDYDFGGDIDVDIDKEEIEQDIDADQNVENDKYIPDGCGNLCEDDSDCFNGCICDCYTFTCETDHDPYRDCYGREYCDTSADCADICNVCDAEDFLCYPQACRDSSTCCPQTACMGGVCIEVFSHCSGDHINIYGMTLIAEGKTAQLEAILYNENNQKVEILNGNRFIWSSDKSEIVDVDTNGLFTGGTVSGIAVITVSLDCDIAITASIPIQNFKAVPETDSRVIVFDSNTDELLDGVDVYLNSTKVTTVAGIAEFPGIDCVNEIQGCELHVLPGDYTYVTALGLGVNDILIPVAPNVDTAKAGGVKGHLDLDGMPEVLVQDIILGLSLFAIPGNLSDMNFKSLFGDMVQTRIQIGQSIDETIPLPSGVEGYLSGTALKDGFQAQGIDGKGTLWGLGGYADLGEIMELVTGSLGGDIEIGVILAAVMPLFENFYHGIMPGVEFDMIDKILDVNDINGNEDFTDMVADFANFKDIGTNFGVTQKQSQSAEITFQDLPAMGDGCADTTITVLGTMEDGTGFIPLGLNVALDENEAGELDCKIGESGNNKTTAVFAPQHSGISGYDYYTISVALSLEKLIDKTEGQDFAFSVTLARSSSSPQTITMPEFLPLISNNTSLNPETHSIQANVIEGANLNRLMLYKDFENEKLTKSWQIYWPSDTENPSFEHLPALADDRGLDINKQTYFQAITINRVTYDDLFDFNATNIDDMNGFMDAFTNYYPAK